jgi:hypothetical protein
MDNWNYDKAIAFIDSIKNPVAQRVTRLFLDRLTLLVHRQEAAPRGEFDLLFFVKAIAAVADAGDLLRMVLDGAEIDAGWRAITEEAPRPRATA